MLSKTKEQGLISLCFFVLLSRMGWGLVGKGGKDEKVGWDGVGWGFLILGINKSRKREYNKYM